jgi:hypothetical protein
MAYEIRKISNYGTQNPVVARLKVQTHELAQWSNLSEDKKLELSAVYFGLADRLLKCHEIYRRISAKIEREISEHRPNADPRMKKVPYVVGLRGEVENFLYESKSYLRDLLSVLDIFFGAKFDEASAFYPTKAGGKSKLVIWAATKFGPSDHFTTMLASEQEWTAELIRKRNAVEHPGGRSGTLHIENFKPLPDGRFASPHWHRDHDQPTGLVQDFETYLENMLTLGEDMLVSCIHHQAQHELIEFIGIPVADRQIECPMRLTVQIDPLKLRPPEPQTGHDPL